MTVSPVPPAGNPAPQATTATGFGGGLTQNDFLNLMIAQLQNQDPLNPISTASFLQEMASFTQVVDMEKLVSMTAEQAAFGLLGKTVSATDASTGKPVSGTVSSVSMTSSGPVLTVNGSEIPFAQVQSVS